MDETFNGLQAVVGAIPLDNTADVGAVQVVIDADGICMSTMRRDGPIADWRLRIAD